MSRWNESKMETLHTGPEPRSQDLERLLAQFAARLPTAPSRPFQLPSIQHLDNASVEALERAANVEGLAPKTCSGFAFSYQRFRTFLVERGCVDRFLSGDLALQQQMLEDWIAWLRERGCSRTTINHYWRGLHSVMARIARRMDAPDPTRAIPTPRPSRPHPRFLTRQSLETVLAFVRHHAWPGGVFARLRNTAIIATMGLTGLRLGEILRLDFGDVDLVEDTIRVRAGKGRYGGKDRTVYLPNTAKAALQEYVTQRPRAGTTRFFISTRVNQPISEVTIRRLCREIERQTGIAVRPHALRHTAATLMRQAGIADRLAMEQLGHSSLTMLQRYSHIASGERQREVRRLDKLVMMS